MKKEKAKTGFGLVFAGLVFFMNPVTQLYDILPDFIGALLIYAGLSKPSLADGYFEDARKLSLYLFWLYIIKTAFSFSLFSYPGNALPFAFLSGVAEIIFVLAFFHKLYMGFEYTFMRNDKALSVYDVNSVYIMSVIFTVAKCALAFLPEMLEFVKQNEDINLSANHAYTMSVIRLKPYAVILALFIQLILGVIFVIKTGKLFGTVRKDSTYIDMLMKKASAQLCENRKKYTGKAMGTSCAFFAASVLFMADIYVEGMDVLPDILSVLCLIIAFAYIGRINPEVRVPKVVCVAALIIGGAYTALSSYVRPEMFELLSGERSSFKEHSEGFWLSGRSAAYFSIFAGVFAVVLALMIIRLIISYQRLYKSEDMGNHDKKLLISLVISCMAAVFKAGCVFFDSCAAHLATNPEVEQFISDRTRMMPEKIAERIAANTKIAHFSSVDNFGIVFSYITVALAVFAVFNIISLKSQVTGEEK